MKYGYSAKGVCAQQIEYEVENGVITDVRFIGGCKGNTQGVAKLCIGRKTEEVIEILEGIKCGMRPTSCPDQLAQALKQSL